MSSVLDGGIIFDVPNAQISFEECETVNKSARSMTVELYLEMVENSNFLIPVVCHKVFLESCLKHNRKYRENIEMLSLTDSIEYKKLSITKSIYLFRCCIEVSMGI